MPAGMVRVLSAVFLSCVASNLLPSLAAEAPSAQEPARLPTVVKSDFGAEKQAAENQARLAMPLALKFEPPTDGRRYKGVYRLEGDGPLGPMRTNADADLVIAPSDQWPARAHVLMKITSASQQMLDGTWAHAEPADLPPETKTRNIEMDATGRAVTDYNPGEAPLSYLADLWPLPREPFGIGDRYVEEVKTKPGKDDPYAFEGRREITLVGTRVVDGVPCASLAIRTDLDAKPVDSRDASTLKIRILGYVTFDTTTGWPVDASQQATWSGRVDEGQGATRPLKLEMSWSLKRVGLANEPPPPAQETDEGKPESPAPSTH